MCRGDVELEDLHQPSQAGRLAFGELQHKSRESGRIDDRVRQRAFEAAADQPRVEGIVAVLDQHRALCETKECPAGIAKFRRPNQHRPIDVVALLGVGIDWRAAIDQGVEKRKRA
jgi:hypothetical protein